MKHMFRAVAISVVLLLCTGITVMASSGSTNGEYSSLLMETVDKFTSYSIGERIGKQLKATENNKDEVIASYGGINVTLEQAEFEKIKAQYAAEVLDKTPKTISTEEAVDMVLRKKLMISDAKSKGLVIPREKLESILQSARISYGIDEKGVATKNAEVNGMLTAAGMTYDEFENQYFREDQEYTMLQFDYWYLIYQEETGKNGHAQPIEEVESVVNAHLNSLLAELKYSR